MNNLIACTISLILLFSSGGYGERKMDINEDALKSYISEATVSDISAVELVGNLVENKEKVFIKQFDISFEKDGHISVLNLVFEDQACLVNKSIFFRNNMNHLTISEEKVKDRVLLPTSNIEILQIFDEKMQMDTVSLEDGEVIRIELIAPKEMKIQVSTGDYLNNVEVEQEEMVTGVGFIAYKIPVEMGGDLIQYVYQGD